MIGDETVEQGIAERFKAAGNRPAEGRELWHELNVVPEGRPNPLGS